MSIDTPTAGERAEADRVNNLLRETEPFRSPGLRANRRAREKRESLFGLNNQAHNYWTADQGDRPGFCLATPGADLQHFKSHNPDHILAPWVVPAWDHAARFIVRPGWTIDRLLKSPEFLEEASTFDRNQPSRLDHGFCYWHDGPIRADSLGGHRCWLLTQTTGQWVGVWWVCSRCKERLDLKYPEGICWRLPYGAAVQ
ncbi:hypothetical protein [Gordonia rubripertincta]|uniref:DUF1963 domain-containing protein n=1 Tax=Gordonia rubripertincta TaxID=36822 RepID=A0ABT4MSV5_GORRU|nr:hypothetical protein [Gordonia rubripertincta]MCZ4550093.1 hypothetical protein [Gordonia rubripertincta]